MNFKKGHSYYNYKQTIISSNHLKDEDVRNEFPDAPDTVIEYITEKRFEQLPDPDYD